MPEPLLRITSTAIMRLFEPSCGLEPVLLSAHFDVSTVKERIASIPDLPLPHRLTAKPLTVLRSQLRSIQHLDFRQAIWADAVLETLQSALQVEGISATIEAIVIELLQGSNVVAANAFSDPLLQFSTLLLSIRLFPTVRDPLLANFSAQFLPSLLDEGSSTLRRITVSIHDPGYIVSTLATLFKKSFMIADGLYSDDEGHTFLDGLIEQVMNSFKTQGDKAKARQKSRHLDKSELGVMQRGILVGLRGLLGNDEELIARWPLLCEMLS